MEGGGFMVRLLFALFLVCGACVSVMAQDTASSAPASENPAGEAVTATGMNDQGANVTKADEGAANNAAAPVEEPAPATPAN
jgi:hypothetical protein